MIDFIKVFYEQYHIPLDPVYIGMMKLGLKNILSAQLEANISKVIAMHTGGIQGAFGIIEQVVGINWVKDENCIEA